MSTQWWDTSRADLKAQVGASHMTVWRTRDQACRTRNWSIIQHR